MTLTTTITATKIIGENEVIQFAYEGPNNGVFNVGLATQSSSPPDFINHGSIIATDTVVGSWGVKGVLYAYDGGFWTDALFLNTGSITVTSSDGDEAIGVGASGWSPHFINTGVISAQTSTGVATGLRGTVTTSLSSGATAPILVNSGQIIADGVGARGVVIQFGSIDNSGTITAHAHTERASDGLAYEANGVAGVGLELLNTGSIIADNSGSVEANGVWTPSTRRATAWSTTAG
jgi:hypothetical protein